MQHAAHGTIARSFALLIRFACCLTLCSSAKFSQHFQRRNPAFLASALKSPASLGKRLHFRWAFWVQDLVNGWYAI